VRLGPGPVFTYEWLVSTRRWQLYAVRAGFVLAILVGMCFTVVIVQGDPGAGSTIPRNELARFGQRLYLTIVSIELAIVLLLAPVATAGAVCLDKARGTLDHMLTTDLSNAEIVLGKLGVRLAPVLGLVACVLPLMAISALLGGIDPNAVFGSFLVAIGCAVLGCSLALALSVWGRKPQDVLMLTYLIIALWLFCRYLLDSVWGASGGSSLSFFWPNVSDAIDSMNPFYLVWAPYLMSRNVSPPQHLGFLAGCLIISGLLAALATMRIRAVAQRRFNRRPARARRPWFAARTARPHSLLPGPSLDGNPVFWREWYRSKPSRFMRVVWMLYWGMGSVFVVLAFLCVVSTSTNREAIAMMNVLQVNVGLLLLAVNAATSLVEERVRGSLDILLSTPISTRSIVHGKWLGTFRSVPQLLFAPALTTFFLACESGHWFSYLNFLGLMVAYSALVVSLGLALATWQSRLERAVAQCVGALVLLAIGWPALVVSLMASTRGHEYFIPPLIMGTPLFGTLFGTMAVAAGTQNMPGSPANVWMGCFLWTAIFGAAATGLFAIVVGTFDRCLGRMPDLMIEWGGAGSLAEESRGFTQEGHDLAELAECGAAIAGGSPIGGVAAQHGQVAPVD
jgi:ABC-type transport system involved in multi-copper enzyme maturation permease subunit